MRAFFLALLLAISAVGCRDRVDTYEEVAENLVERGKNELGRSEFQTASATFARAQQYDPTNEEARFGHALSELLIFYEQVSLVVRAAGFGDFVPEEAQPGQRPGDGMADEADMYNQIVLDVLLPLRDEVEAAAAELDALGGSDFEFRVGSVPLVWNTSVILNLGGTWRDGDVRLLGSLAHGIAGTLDVLFAHELRFDLFDTLDYFTAYTGSFESFDFTAAELLNTLVHVLTVNPQFLDIIERDADGDGQIDGVALPKRASAHFQRMAADLAGLRERVERRPGLLRAEPGSSGVLAVLALENALVVGKNSKGELQYGVIELPITEGFEAGWNALAANLDGSKERLGWKDHVLPMVSVFAVTAAGVVSQLDFDLSETVKSVLSLIRSPQSVETLVLEIVPDVIQLDPAGYFAKPIGVRAMLPRWREDTLLPENERSFLLEWECPSLQKDVAAPAGSTKSILHYTEEGETGYHFTCPENVAVDSAHFPAVATSPSAAIFAEMGIARIESDSLASGLPYIVFGAPSFGGLLWLHADEAGAAGSNPIGQGDFAPAGQRGLNALLAQVYTDLGL